LTSSIMAWEIRYEATRRPHHRRWRIAPRIGRWHIINRLARRQAQRDGQQQNSKLGSSANQRKRSSHEHYNKPETVFDLSS